VYPKPVPLSPQVLLDRERCVLCARCTRFCDQISGERFIELFDRSAAEQVSISAGEDFASPFSGNTVQICPVGALTNASYRFAARPFDLRSGDSICPHCACGCNLRVDLRRGEVVRHLARDNAEVNDAWICDKGRNAFRFPDRARLETPMLRVPGLEPASYGEVFAAIADRAQSGRVAFLGGGRLTDEDAYAMSKLARTVFRTNDVDHRLAPVADGGIERLQAGSAPSVTYTEVEHAKAIVVVGLDAREELPILHLRIRKAWRNGGARVFEVNPRRTALSEFATFVPALPGREAEAVWGLRAGEGPLAEVAAALRDAGEAGIVLAGSRLAGSPGDALSGLAAVANEAGARFVHLPRRAGERGAMRAGVHPSLLPGGRRVEDDAERAEVEARWGEVPHEAGRDTQGILEASARREIDVLFLVGADPLVDVPDPALVRRALENVPFKVVQDISLGEYEPYADAALPAAAFLERSGHFTDWEGRGQRFEPVREPPGLARPDWQIFQELSEAAGADMGFTSLDALHQEMGRLLVPRRMSWLVGSARPESLPPRTDGELTLFSYPLLVDDGRQSVDADELKAALHEDPFVELHPADAERLGLADGDAARLRTEAGEAMLPVRISGGIAPGAAFVPWNQAGFRANALFSGAALASVTLEAAEAVVAEEAG